MKNFRSLLYVSILFFGIRSHSSATNCNHSFTLGTMNLWHYSYDYEKRKENLKQKFFDVPDIIGVQEAWTWFRTSLYKDFLVEFERRSKMYAYFTESNSWPSFKEGLAVISKYPLSDHGFYYLPYSKWYSKRILQITRLKLKYKRIWVLNTHFSPFNRRHERIAQVEFLVQLVQQLEELDGIFIVGDMNDELKSEIFKPLLDLGFRAAQEVQPLITYSTNNLYADQNGEGKAIDHLFYKSKAFYLDKVELIYDTHPISDHYGLKGTWCLRE